MANRDSTTNEPASTIATRPYNQAFSWLPNNIADDASARFAADVKDATYGGLVIANLVRSKSLEIERGERPLLSDGDMDSLVGLLIFSMDALNEAAEKHIDWLEAAASKGVKK